MPRERLAELKCVVDVGANVGNWSVAIARITGAKQIIAFEPIPNLFERLQQSAREYPQIHCEQLAIGASSGQVTLNVERVHQLSSVLKMRNETRSMHGMSQDDTEQIVVPMNTLDDALSDCDEVSLLKLDVQGYEPEVFAGARTALKRTRILMTEVTYTPYYHGDLQLESYLDLIRSCSNLRLWGISAPGCSPLGRPMSADAIFVQAV
jgi:FkbM family methyltransferase